MDPMLATLLTVLLSSGLTALLVSYMKHGWARALAMLVLLLVVYNTIGEMLSPNGQDALGYGFALVVGLPVSLVLTIVALAVIDRRAGTGSTSLPSDRSHL